MCNNGRCQRAGKIKNSLTLLVALPLLLLATPILANDTKQASTDIRVSKSVGTRKSSVRPDVELAKPQLERGLQKDGERKAPHLLLNQSAARKVRPFSHQAFWINHADVVLGYDDDHDGYYHAFSLSFEADVDHGSAFVYAKVFLSYEDGPWNLLYTTDVFSIYPADPDNAYEVISSLEVGYEPGYYDVLIELYEADYDHFVADFGPRDDTELMLLPLEDVDHEDVVVEGDAHGFVAVEVHGGGGGIGIGSLVLLLFLGVGLKRFPARRARQSDNSIGLPCSAARAAWSQASLRVTNSLVDAMPLFATIHSSARSQ
ncbi:MAG: choice-of-anchor H family protein [Gammaproteobacteria bacterium]